MEFDSKIRAVIVGENTLGQLYWLKPLIVKCLIDKAFIYFPNHDRDEVKGIFEGANNVTIVSELAELNYSEANLILIDTCSDTDLLLLLRKLYPKTPMVACPHGNSIYPFANNRDKTGALNNSVLDYLIVSNSLDIGHYSAFVPKQKIIEVGYPIELSSGSSTGTHVSVFLRGAHIHYLRRIDYYKLCIGLIFVFIRHGEKQFVLKLHPRQGRRDKFMWAQIARCFKNLTITNKTPEKILSDSQAIISFWSSIFVDAFFWRIPAIEYYRYNTRSTVVEWDYNSHNGKIQSYYSKCGLVNSTKSWKEVSQFLDSKMSVKRNKFTYKRDVNINFKNAILNLIQ